MIYSRSSPDPGAVAGTVANEGASVTANAIERVGRQMSIAEITEEWDAGSVHYVVSAGRADTGFYSVSCSCGFFTSSGKSPATAHALMRAHRAGHNARTPENGD